MKDLKLVRKPELFSLEMKKKNSQKVRICLSFENVSVVNHNTNTRTAFRTTALFQKLRFFRFMSKYYTVVKSSGSGVNFHLSQVSPSKKIYQLYVETTLRRLLRKLNDCSEMLKPIRIT